MNCTNKDLILKITTWIVFLGLIVAIILTGGCASQDELKLAYDAQTSVVREQASQEQVPTLSIDCTLGCGKTKIVYIAHEDRQQIKIPTVYGTNATIIGVAPTVSNALSTGFQWGFGYLGVKALTENLGGGNVNTHNTNTISGDKNTLSANPTLDVSKTTTGDTTSTVGDSDRSVNDSYNPINNSQQNQQDNNAVADSYNPVDNSQTATPTVVDPVVVDPVIVNQPPPLVIPPTIVRP